MYVKVRFVKKYNVNPQTYDYYTDLKLGRGDYVLVPSAYSFSLAKVVEVMDKSYEATKMVVQKIDMAGYVERKKRFERLRSV